MNPRDLDLQSQMVFKRFISWIRLGLKCSKGLYRGFDLETCLQKICFVDLIRKDKILKRFSWSRFVHKARNLTI